MRDRVPDRSAVADRAVEPDRERSRRLVADRAIHANDTVDRDAQRVGLDGVRVPAPAVRNVTLRGRKPVSDGAWSNLARVSPLASAHVIPSGTYRFSKAAPTLE